MVINMINVNSNSQNTNTSTEDTSGGLIYNEIYSFPTNPTDYQKDLYVELSNVLEEYTYDENDPYSEQSLELAELIVKNYVADFFTWTNKASTYDVGGVTYNDPINYLTAQFHARNTFYQQLDGYIEQYGREDLIEVNDITIPAIVESGSFYFNGQDYNSIYVMANWTYNDSSKIDVQEFQRGAEFKVINYEGTWYIGQLWGVEVD
jgi:hypothetical protein